MINKEKVTIFLPLLLLYVAIVLFFSSNELTRDQGRYFKYAENLSRGYYVSSNDIDIPHGPGYSIVLLPFVFLNAPLLIPKLINGLFLFLAVLYFYRTLSLYMNEKSAIFFSYLTGIYPPILNLLPFLMSEVFTFFLLCGLIFNFCNLCQNNYLSWRNILVTSFFLAYIALTRSIFGYVILLCVFIVSVSYLIKKNKNTIKSLLILTIALLFSSPFVVYTYSLTGKKFYWGTSGGELLYWMSTPYKHEYGEWHSKIKVNRNKDLKMNHGDFYNKLNSFSKLKQDKMLKSKAIKNIIDHPEKYLINWGANLGRLFFGYPYSYTPQKMSTYFYIFPNMFLIVVLLLCLYPFYLGRQFCPFEIVALSVFGMVYIGGSSLLSAIPRYFTIIVPVIILWISFILTNIVKFDIRK